jgi:hypothetical protein
MMSGTGERVGRSIAVIQADIYPIPKRDFGRFEKIPSSFQPAR